MRHANAADLDRLEPLLDRLRGIPGLRERRPGSFARGPRGFLHFHEDHGDLYADVRLEDGYTRLRVTTTSEQNAFIAKVKRAIKVDAITRP